MTLRYDMFEEYITVKGNKNIYNGEFNSYEDLRLI